MILRQRSRLALGLLSVCLTVLGFMASAPIWSRLDEPNAPLTIVMATQHRMQR